jgi:hypothetical protein
MIVVTGVLVAGCGSSLDAYCEGVNRDRLCLYQKACGVAAPDASCADVGNTSRITTDGCDAPLREAVANGSVRYDPALAARCAAEAKTTCGRVEACDAVFQGTVRPGGGCRSAQECEVGWCDRSTTCPGECRPFASSGDAVVSSEACGPLGVEYASDGGIVCHARQPVGTACGSSAECEEALCINGTCVRLGAKNEACPCAFGFRCLNDTCQPWARLGEACANEFFVPGPACQLGLACQNGVCGPLLTEGQSCENNPNRCAPHLTCKGRPATCVPLADAGVPCTSSFFCARDLVCVAGSCLAPRTAGQACGARSECELGLGCEGGSCVTLTCSVQEF